MNAIPINLLLADDDPDDCILFKEALDELAVPTLLRTVSNGEQLMHLLHQTGDTLPDMLFLDLNMPRKTGLECLSEIKKSEKLKSLPVIIYSTSLDHDIVNQLYENGATYYIRKPGEFSKLKKVILEAMDLASQKPLPTSKENFVIQV